MQKRRVTLLGAAVSLVVSFSLRPYQARSDKPRPCIEKNPTGQIVGVNNVIGTRNENILVPSLFIV